MKGGGDGGEGRGGKGFKAVSTRDGFEYFCNMPVELTYKFSAIQLNMSLFTRYFPSFGGFTSFSPLVSFI